MSFVSKTAISTRGLELGSPKNDWDQDPSAALVQQVVKGPFDRMSGDLTDRYRASPLSTISEDSIVKNAGYFSLESLERMGDGLLATLVRQTDKNDINSIAVRIMEAKKGSDCSTNTIPKK